MSQDKRTFPRDLENDSEFQRELLEDTKLRLEAAERQAEFVPDLKEVSPPPMVVYGPPEYFRDRVAPPAPAYGPAPMPIIHSRISTLVGVVLALIAVAIIVVGLFFFFLK